MITQYEEQNFNHNFFLGKPTVGDGYCRLHGAFGSKNKEGKYEFKPAKEFINLIKEFLDKFNHLEEMSSKAPLAYEIFQKSFVLLGTKENLSTNEGYNIAKKKLINTYGLSRWILKFIVTIAGVSVIDINIGRNCIESDCCNCRVCCVNQSLNKINQAYFIYPDPKLLLEINKFIGDKIPPYLKNLYNNRPYVMTATSEASFHTSHITDDLNIIPVAYLNKYQKKYPHLIDPLLSQDIFNKKAKVPFYPTNEEASEIIPILNKLLNDKKWSKYSQGGKLENNQRTVGEEVPKGIENLRRLVSTQLEKNKLREDIFKHLLFHSNKQHKALTNVSSSSEDLIFEFYKMLGSLEFVDNVQEAKKTASNFTSYFTNFKENNDSEVLSTESEEAKTTVAINQQLPLEKTPSFEKETKSPARDKVKEPFYPTNQEASEIIPLLVELLNEKSWSKHYCRGFKFYSTQTAPNGIEQLRRLVSFDLKMKKTGEDIFNSLITNSNKHKASTTGIFSSRKKITQEFYEMVGSLRFAANVQDAKRIVMDFSTNFTNLKKDKFVNQILNYFC